MVNPEPEPQAQPMWKVGIPRQTTIADPQRGYIPGWEIPIIMADKSSFTVTVAADQFTPENVRETIEEHVARLIGVRTLEGPTY